MEQAIIVGMAVVFPLGFAGMWVGITFLLGALSGWFPLQRRFPDTGEAAILTLRTSGYMGAGVRLNGILRLSACRSGLRAEVWKPFGLFQKPFLVPWSEVRDAPDKRLFITLVKLSFGSPEAGALSVTQETWRRLSEAAKT